MAVAEASRRRKASGGGASRRGGHGPWWWGDGAPPLERWPGVTIDFPAVWSSKEGRWQSPNGRYYFDAGAADRACSFFPDMLTHHIGEFAGRPFALMEYQKKLLTRPIFGWKDARDGRRRCRKVFAFLPKGAGKSPWSAGTMIYMVRCDGEAAAEGYALANDRNQARTVHENCKIMVEDSPHLKEGAEILKDSIYWAATRSTLQVLSSEASSAHGKRPHVLSFDELHGFSGDRDRELFEALVKSLAKRRQPLLIIITHAGTDDEGLAYEEYEYAKNVLGGSVPDETCLPVVFEAKAGDDWTSIDVLKRVHPGYGVTVQPNALATDLIGAQADPRKQNDYKRYYLNIWTNQATAWIPVEWVDACEEAIPSDEELRLLPCAGSLDLAQKIDLACFTLTFRRRLASTQQVEIAVADDDGVRQPETKIVELNYALIVVPFFWIPEDTMREHERDDRVPYSEWARAGLITPTEGVTIDYTRIYRDITTKIMPRFPLLKQGGIGYDPAFATDIATSLRDRAGLPIEEILQNYKYMSEPCQVLEALIKSKRFIHGGHRVLRNHFEHVAIKTDDAGRIRPVRPRRRGKHIDGVVATLMGLRKLAAVSDRKKSVAVFAV